MILYVPIRFLFFSLLVGNVDLKLKSEKGVEIALDITDNEDGTYLVDYAVPAGGDYSLQCRYGDVQIPQSPLKIRVPSNVDVSKIKVDGLETSKTISNIIILWNSLVTRLRS